MLPELKHVTALTKPLCCQNPSEQEVFEKSSFQELFEKSLQESSSAHSFSSPGRVGGVGERGGGGGISHRGDYCEAGEVTTRKTEEKCTFGTRNTFCTGGGRGVEDEVGGEGGGAPDVANLGKDVRYLRQQVELVKSTFQGLKSDR